MTATIDAKAISEGKDQWLVLRRVSWNAYVGVSEALGEQRGLRLIYADGRLELLTKSRRHQWFAECLGQFIAVVSSVCRIPWEAAGETTFRLKDLDVGLEGDRTYYLGANALLMRGPKNVELPVDPPPDLAIEVEVSHSADAAVIVYGRLGVPEVWRFDAEAWAFGIWARNPDRTYSPSVRSTGLPLVTAEDVLEQMRRADALGMAEWYEQLREWVHATLLPRSQDSH
jgi:Uma2 family endonuclease